MANNRYYDHRIEPQPPDREVGAESADKSSGSPDASAASVDPSVVVEIGTKGDGLNWIDGQGDLSTGEPSWYALDAEANPEQNLALLREVAGRRLEPRFAAEIARLIAAYEEIVP